MYNKAKELLTWEKDFDSLSERSDEVDIKTEIKEAREIISMMKHTMQKNDLKVLAAPEIGYNKRIICIAFQEEIKTLIDPIICHAEDIQLAKETSNTVPNKKYIKPRSSKVDIMYLRPTGQPESKQFVGMAAVLYQQGQDALDGIAPDDIGLEIDDEFENASDEEKSEVIKMYLDSLDLLAKNINKEIEETPELKQMSDASKFIASVQSGETQIDR